MRLAGSQPVNQSARVSAPTLALLHGLGAHSGWFNDMANSLNAAGLHVYVPDHRGFGRSEGERGHTRDWRTYVADTSALLDEIWAGATREALTWTHRWRVGDLVLWDNRCTMHRRDAFDSSARRVMHRTQIKAS